MRYFVTIGEREIEVDLTGTDPIVDGRPVKAELGTAQGGAIRHLIVDGRSVALVVRKGDRRGRWNLALGADRISVDAVDERTRAIREMTGAEADETAKTIVAPMPGLVVRIEVEVGQHVKAGQGVVVVEAMKMENELKAPGDGVIAEIRARTGETVEKGAVLLVLE
ncbi:MAG: biotin/lipoyl-binding protein [Gemmatimonadetes bacterium]|nr:biotin/lipoyl-binding protein [Gemmatimonadota bacterium]